MFLRLIVWLWWSFQSSIDSVSTHLIPFFSDLNKHVVVTCTETYEAGWLSGGFLSVSVDFWWELKNNSNFETLHVLWVSWGWWVLFGWFRCWLLYQAWSVWGPESILGSSPFQELQSTELDLKFLIPLMSRHLLRFLAWRYSCLMLYKFYVLVIQNSFGTFDNKTWSHDLLGPICIFLL